MNPSEQEARGDGRTPHGRAKKHKLGTFRGVETMFRSAYRVQLDLTNLADNKANIMISINAIIIPLILVAVTQIETGPALLVPLTAMLITCLISIVYAILSARPRVKSVVRGPEDLVNRDVNLLFFGNYAHLSEDRYVDAMTDLIQDRDRLYRSMIRDLYGIGRVLGRKFELLRHAYTVFMVGLIASIALFFLVLALNALGNS